MTLNNSDCFCCVKHLRAGQDYDYIFDVDGERRYDFDCDFGSVEVCDGQAYGFEHSQVIIAN